MNFVEIKTTFDNEEDAIKMCEGLVGAKISACTKISEVRSVYNWEGKLENNIEYLLSAKIKEQNINQAIIHIKATHKYDLPEIIVTPIIGGSEEYLNWLENNS